MRLDWILAPIALAGLVGFIWFGFSQGLKVEPKRPDGNLDRADGDIRDIASHGGSD